MPLDIQNEPDSSLPAVSPQRGVGRGFACALALHGLIALLIVFLLPWLTPVPPPEEQVVPIELVQLADKTTAPAGRPQPEQARSSSSDLPVPEPVPPRLPEQLPPPPPEHPQPREGPKLDPLAEVTPEKKPAPPREITPRRNVPEGPHPTPPGPRVARAGEGAVLSGLASSGADVGAGSSATVNPKDFIRAQVERHWEFDARALRSADFTVAIHVVLNRDGSVFSAEIVDDPRHVGDAFYHAVAMSARSAVLASSPLQLPPGAFESFKDITLEFNPREALR